MMYVVNRSSPTPPPIENVTLTVTVDEVRLLASALLVSNPDHLEARGFSYDARMAAYLQFNRLLREVNL